MTKEHFLSALRLKYKEGDFFAIKFLFEMYFELNLNSSETLNEHNEISKIYIDFLVNINSINVSKTNPIYKKLEETKLIVREKLISKEPLTDLENDLQKLIVYKPFYIVHWGFHSGDSLSNIFIKNPCYVLWCIINLEHFAVENVIFYKLKFLSKSSEYIKALEVNYVKLLIIEKWGTNNQTISSKNSNENSEPDLYGFKSWDEMAFNVAFEENIDAWNNYNQ